MPENGTLHEMSVFIRNKLRT